MKKPGHRAGFFFAKLSVQPCHFEFGGALLDHAESYRGALRKIETPAPHEGATVIDTHDDRAARPRIGDAKSCPERHGPTCASIAMGIEVFSRGSAMTMRIE